MMYDGYGAGWGWSMMAMMLLSWVVVVAGLVWAVVWIRNQRRADHDAVQPSGSALELLDRRFAAGGSTTSPTRTPATC